jgi:hypothetical protein
MVYSALTIFEPSVLGRRVETAPAGLGRRILRSVRMKNWKPIAATAALLAGVAWAQASSAAAIVIQDNFDSDAAVFNWPGDSVFTSIPGPGDINGQPSVDLVGTADGYGSLAFSGNSVDLDGSTGTGFSPAGEIQSTKSLGNGDYIVSFELAGNLRSAPVQTLAVAVGGQVQDLTVPANQAYALQTLTFDNASGKVSFTDLGPASQQGNLIDNITVTDVPEPATWAVMLLGFGGVGAAMRSNRRKLAASAA